MRRTNRIVSLRADIADMRRALRASLLLDLSCDQKMRDEAEQKGSDTDPGIQGRGDQQLG